MSFMNADFYYFVFLFACLRVSLIFFKVDHFIFVADHHFWLSLEAMFPGNILRIKYGIIIAVLYCIAILLMTQSFVSLTYLWLIFVHLLLNFLLDLKFIQTSSPGNRHRKACNVILILKVSIWILHWIQLSLLTWFDYGLF